MWKLAKHMSKSSSNSKISNTPKLKTLLVLEQKTKITQENEKQMHKRQGVLNCGDIQEIP